MKKILLFLILMFGMFHQAAANSMENIQYHLKLVENVLREVDTSSLTQEQKNNRVEKLNILSEYTENGEFPNNDVNSELTSIFRGSNGNLCAVGYLMYSDPEYQDYVDEIVSSNNLIRVMTIQDDSIFQKWLAENGFTQIELAMIQPSYVEIDPNTKTLDELIPEVIIKYILIPLVILMLGTLYFKKTKVKTGNLEKLIIRSCIFILTGIILLAILGITLALLQS